MAVRDRWSERSAAATFEDLMVHWRGLDAVSIRSPREGHSKARVGMERRHHPDENCALPLTEREDLAMIPNSELIDMTRPFGLRPFSTLLLSQAVVTQDTMMTPRTSLWIIMGRKAKDMTWEPNWMVVFGRSFKKKSLTGTSGTL